MKKLLFVLLSIFILSCEIEYDGETKLVVKGKVLLENNLPLENQEIKLYVNRESFSIPFIFYIPSETNFIGKATTNSMGEYTMVIPKPIANYNEIILELNSNNSYNNRQIRNIDTNDFSNFELTIEPTKLYQLTNLASLSVNLNQVNSNYQFIKINYVGEYTSEISFFKPIDNENYAFYNDLYQLVQKNQELIIQWEVKDITTNTILNFEEVLIIDESDFIEYTLNY
jgi:hypothetical protein